MENGVDDFLLQMQEDFVLENVKPENKERNSEIEQKREQFSTKFQNCFNKTENGEIIRKQFYEEIKLKKREKAHFNRKKHRRENHKEKIEKYSEKNGNQKIDVSKIIEESKERILLLKKKLVHGKINGLRIAFDLSYNSQMLEKEQKSLAFQLGYSYNVIRKSENPISLNFCSCNGPIRQHLNKLGADFWFVNSHELSFEIIFQNELSKVIYLSPDADQAIEEFDLDHIYVIGGLVDNTIQKNQSKLQANEAGVQCRKLPLELVDTFGKWRKSLNVNTVVQIIDAFMTFKNMKKALEVGLPPKYTKCLTKTETDKSKIPEIKL